MEQFEQTRRLRLTILQVVIVITFVILALRIYQLQFLQEEEFVLQAADNRLDEISIPATRGIVLDRFGNPLAINTASARVTVTPALLPGDDAEEVAVLERVAGLARDKTDKVHAALDALEECLKGLSERQRCLIRDRYGEGGSVKEIARQRAQSVAAISTALYKVRQKLLACMKRQRVVREAHA